MHALGFDALAAAHRIEQGQAQFEAQLGQHQLRQQQRGFAGGVAQITASPFADMQDLPVAIDQHAGRRVPLHGQAMRLGQ